MSKMCGLYTTFNQQTFFVFCFVCWRKEGMSYSLLFSLIIFFLCLFKGNCSFLTKEIDQIEVCSPSQFFDSTSLTCKFCDPNKTNHKTPNQTSIDSYGNFLSCKCSIGYQEIQNDCSQVPLFLAHFPSFCFFYLFNYFSFAYYLIS